MAKKEAISKVAKKTAKVAATNWQPILMVFGIGLASYIAYKAVNGVLDFNPGNDPGAGGSSNQDPNGNNPVPGATITKNQAKNIAAALLQAMAFEWGTDEERIFSLFTGKNHFDYSLISNEFGTPRYDGYGEAFWPFPETPLSHWLSSELDQGEMNHLKQIIPGVF